jgi:hypothetical protein
MAPLQRPVIEAELQSAQILSAPLVAEEKVAPEPTVEILYQGTGWDRLFSQFGDGFTDIAEPTTQLWAQDSFLLPAQAIAVVAESICGTPRNNSAGHWNQPQASSGSHRAAAQKPGTLIAPDKSSWPKHGVTMS